MTALMDAEHLQATAWAHMQNSRRGFRASEQFEAAMHDLEELHAKLRAAEDEEARWAPFADRPVLAELAAGTPDRDAVAMSEMLAAADPKTLRWYRAQLLQSATNAVGWVEQIDDQLSGADQGRTPDLKVVS